MQKALLTLATLGLASIGAQAQWVNQPFATGGSTFIVTQVDAINATTGWGWGIDLMALNAQVIRTTDGTTWTKGAVATLAADEFITSLQALNATTAWITTHNETNDGGRVLKTTDGGVTWTAQTTATQFAGATSWPNFVHFFDANNGVAAGDPDGSATPGFEIYRTTNGGTTWTRVTNVPAALSGEYGATGAIDGPIQTGVGNSVWFATNEGRVYRSSDQGLTWSVSNTGLNDAPTGLAFTSATTGLAVVADGSGSGYSLRRTADGGATWTSVTYTGPLHGVALDNVPGSTAYVSVGADGADAGSSYSLDNGQTWINLENTLDHTAVDMASATVGWSGSVSVAQQMGTGLNKFNGTITSTRRDAGLQQALSVYPNPSRDGLFTLNLATALPQATDVRVTDALGREVYRTTLSATTARTSGTSLDLRQQRAGLYTLELRSAAGVAQQKLVIQ